MRSAQFVSGVVRPAIVLVLLICGSSATPARAARARTFDAGRPSLDACLSARTAIKNASDLLRTRDVAYRPFVESARFDVSNALTTATQAEWPVGLRRTHRLVERALSTAGDQLLRSQNPKLAARFGRVAAYVHAAGRRVAKVTLLLDDAVPPAPPGLSNDPVVTPPETPAPTDFMWTDLTPSADSRVVYVSNVDGDDTWDGLYPDHSAGGNHGPMKSWWGATGALSKLRPGYPDWLLLKRGETWTFTNDLEEGVPPDWNLRQRVARRLTACPGRSAAEPSVISTYGDASLDRPLIINTNLLVGSVVAYAQDGTPSVVTASHCAVVGLDFRRIEELNPSTGCSISGPSVGGVGQHDILIEDCRFDGYQNNMDITPPNPTDGHISDIRIRGCVLINGYSSKSIFSGGVFCNYADNVLFEGCLIDHNGWHADTIPLVSGLSLNATTKKVTRSTGSFIADGYQECVDRSHRVQLDGFANAANNGRFDVVSVTDTQLELSGDGNDASSVTNLVSESSSSAHQVSLYWLGDIFAHSTYFGHDATNVAFRGNIVARGGGLGVRAGGLMEDNLLLQTTVSNWSNLVPTTIRRNVWLDGENIHGLAGQNLGWGIQLTFDGSRHGSPITTYPVAVYDNILANNVTGRQPIGLFFGPDDFDETHSDDRFGGGPVHDLDVHGNIFYNYGRGIWPSDLCSGHVGASVSIANNVVATVGDVVLHDDLDVEFKARYTTVFYSNLAIDTGIVFSANTWYSDNSYSAIVPDLNYIALGTTSGQSEWVARTRETGAIFSSPSFPDPTRSVGSYNALMGGASTLDAFLSEARRQSRASWRPSYTSRAVNEYIRGGFGR